LGASIAPTVMGSNRFVIKTAPLSEEASHPQK
jgi:hypothetical protein